MSFCQKGEQYAKDVLEGKIIANKWIKQACKRHFDDLKKDEYVFDPAKVERVAKFISLMPHTKGKWAAQRQNLVLEPWQIFALCMPFGWLKKDGTRRFRKILLFVCRKNGKSAVAAALGNYMFCADGEFGAEVYSGATTEKQAWEVFRPAKLMIERTPQLKDVLGVSVNASNLSRVADGSRFEPVIGTPGDGASPSCAIIDEYHEHKDNSLYDTMETGMGARDNPLMLVITTAGSNLGGPCDLFVRDAKKMLDGAVDIPDLWACIFGKDDDDEWDSDIAMAKANPNLDISVSKEFLQARLRDAKMSATKQAVYRTKHLNEWVGAKNVWMNMSRYNEAPPRKSLSELDGRPCYIGLDLASKIDVCALVLVFPPFGDESYHVHARYYLPDARVLEMDTNCERYRAFDNDGYLTLCMGEVVDFEQVKDDIKEFVSRFDVRELAYDPWQATQLAQELEKDGIVMVEMRPTVQNFSEPMKSLEALILQKKIAHGDCPVMRWMMGNVVAKLDKKDNIFPDKERPDAKIDGVVALIMALGRCLTHERFGNIDDFLNNMVMV